MKRWSDLGKDVEKIMALPKEKVRSVCIEAATSIIEKTPVDEGGARGNWQASLDTPASGVLAVQDTSGQAAITKANSVAVNAPGSVFYLTNNSPYIQALEFGLYGTGAGATEKTTRDGYSIQAPHGMVGLTVQEIMRRLR